MGSTKKPEKKSRVNDENRYWHEVNRCFSARGSEGMIWQKRREGA